MAHRIKVVLATLLLVVVAFGLAFYFRPLEMLRAQTRLSLAWHGGRSHIAHAGNYRVHYYEMNAGRPDAPVVVLIHGLGGSALDWAPMMPAFARAGYRVYAPDLLGYGKSSHPDIDYSIAEQADFVNGFIHAVGACNPQPDPRTNCRQDIVGWSMGGWIAMRYALDHEQQVRRLVLDDAAGVNFEPSFSPAVFTPGDADTAAQLMHLLEPSMPRFPPFVMRDYLRMLHTKRDVVGRSVKTFETRKEVMDAQLPHLDVPTLVNWGTEDLLIPLNVGKKTAALIPGANLNIFEGCGHLAPARCSEKVTPATVSFLTANPAPRGEVQTIAEPRKKHSAKAASSQQR